MTRRRGDLFRDVLAAMPPGAILSTPQVADAVPGTSRALVGVVLRRCTLKGLVIRVDAEPRTQTGTKPATWKRTGAAYEVGKGGARPQPDKPHSRHKPRPAKQQPSVKRTPAQVAMRERIHVQTTQPEPRAIAAPSTEAFIAAHPERLQVLPPSRYVPAPCQPVGWKS